MGDTRKPISYFSLTVVILVLWGCTSCTSRSSPEVNSATGTNGVVVSPHPIASTIGLNVLQDGGNAIDAAVATGLALGVVDQFNSGIGGGGFIVARLANGTVFTIDGREKAPSGASRDMYVRHGEFDPGLSERGPLAVGVPGILAAYDKVLELAGTKALSELILPSVKVARDGFALDWYYVSRYSDATGALKKDRESARIYLHSDGSPLAEGDVLKQPDLAGTYRKIGEDGLDYFYRGEFARRLADYMATHGGLITAEDMRNYRALLREPIIGTYRHHTMIGMGPPSSGGIQSVQMLNMIAGSDILNGNSSWNNEAIFLISQFMEKSFEDRAMYLGDSDFYPVPVRSLTSKAYADSLVSLIVHAGKRPRQIAAAQGEEASGHTSSFCIIDRWGNAVSVNQTVNHTYGAKITVPGTGVILNNQMDDFSAQPGVPNSFDLIGSEANAIEPGKRPLSSMSPTIVLQGDKPVMILGGAGGPKIITAVVQTIIAVLDFDMPLEEALFLPRFHHQFQPPFLYMEKRTPKRLQVGQKLKGRDVVTAGSLGRVEAIAWSERGQFYVGVADPRSGGGAEAY